MKGSERLEHCTENCQQHEKNDHRIKLLEEALERYNTNQIEIVKGQHEIREKLTVALESTKSAHHRLDSMEAQTEAIIRLAVSVEHMSEKMDNIMTHMKAQDDQIKEQSGRIDKLDKAPAEAILAYWKMFIGALVTGAAGVLLGLVITKLNK